jgi:hypothetical protein
MLSESDIFQRDSMVAISPLLNNPPYGQVYDAEYLGQAAEITASSNRQHDDATSEYHINITQVTSEGSIPYSTRDGIKNYIYLYLLMLQENITILHRNLRS